MASQPTADQKRHWTRIAELGCILTGLPAEIAHCHGGSMKVLGPKWQPGMAQRQDHWLVIPLAPGLHRMGPHSLDCGSVDEWEHRWKPQIELLREVSENLGYCVFTAAGVTVPEQSG